MRLSLAVAACVFLVAAAGDSWSRSSELEIEVSDGFTLVQVQATKLVSTGFSLNSTADGIMEGQPELVADHNSKGLKRLHNKRRAVAKEEQGGLSEVVAEGPLDDAREANHRAYEAPMSLVVPENHMVGYLCVLVSCILFGSNFIPVKLVDTRDGQFFGLWMAVGIFIVGCVQWAIVGYYRFEPFAMLGGAVWAIGNLFVPYIVRRCGLGVGQLVWGATNMLTGWATGTFGLFGKHKETVAFPSLNYAGVLLGIVSLGVFTFMKSERKDTTEPKKMTQPASGSQEERGARTDFVRGFIVAIVVGVFFGSNFNPPTYLQQLGQADVAAHLPPRHSPKAMDYVLSHFTGILLFTLASFFVFRASAPNCYVGTKVILPGLVAGMGWGVAQLGWFKANSSLSYVVAFPIIVGVPGVLASVWGVVLFGENRERRNLMLLGVVIAVQAVSVMLIALSKDGLTLPRMHLHT